MKYKISIQGMTCGHCQSRVLDALQKISGVIAAEVNLSEGFAWVDALEYVTPQQLTDAVEDWGYTVTGVEKL